MPIRSAGESGTDAFSALLSATKHRALAKKCVRPYSPLAATNPYRAGDALSWTTSHSDFLGRADQAAHLTGCGGSTSLPTSGACSGSSGTATNSYNFNSTTATDEAGKQKIVTTDALGDMTSVQEDPTGQNYLTQYAYDTLNDLTQVIQCDPALARPRT